MTTTTSRNARMATAAAALAEFLTTHLDLPDAAQISLDDSDREINVQTRDATVVARWAAAIGAQVVVEDGRAYVSVHAVSALPGSEQAIRVWTHIHGREAYRALHQIDVEFNDQGTATIADLDAFELAMAGVQ